MHVSLILKRLRHKIALGGSQYSRRETYRSTRRMETMAIDFKGI